MPDSTDILTRVDGKRRLEFWEANPPEDGLVYLIQGERRAPVKVGHATNVKRRLRELQTGNHVQLHVLDVIPGSKEAERAVHEQLAPHRVLGEWFKWDGAVEQWLLLRSLAEQMMTFYRSTGRVADLVTFAPWHELVELGKPKIPQSIPGQEIDSLVPTIADQARRTWISPNPELNLLR